MTDRHPLPTPEAALWISACGDVSMEDCWHTLGQQLSMLHDLFTLLASNDHDQLSDDSCRALAELTRDMSKRVCAMADVFPGTVATWSPHTHTFGAWVIKSDRA